jgi:hypothetical protein
LSVSETFCLWTILALKISVTGPISAPLDGVVITEGSSAAGLAQAFLDRLDGMLSATIQANFTWGGGGTSLAAVVETSFDHITWVEVARFAFTTASAVKLINISASTEILAAYAAATLSNDTGKSGVFGDRWRCKVTSVGTYTNNTSLSMRLVGR